jgi:trigger factor
MDLVEKNINRAAVEDEAIQDLISEAYPKILEETKYRPVDYPSIKVISREEGKPLVFSLEIDLYPEVKLGKIKGIKVQALSTEVEEKDVLDTLGSLQNRFAKYSEVSRPAENGDLVVLDLTSKEGDKDFPIFNKKAMSFPIGAAWIDKRFDEALIGIKVGETKEFTLKFDDKHAIKDVQGKKITFSATATKISGRELEPLTDEFAKKVSGLGTLAELKEEVMRSLKGEKAAQADATVKDQLVAGLLKECEVDVPEAMVRVETEIMVDELKQSLAENRLTLDAYLKSVRKTEAEIKAELKPGAEVRTKSKVIMRAIAEQEGLKCTEDEFDAELMKYAAAEGETLDNYKKKVGPNARDFIDDYIVRHKALDFVLSHAKISEPVKKGE